MNDKDKSIEITESPIVVSADVEPNITEVQEILEDVIVQVSTPLTARIEDTEIIDIEISEAFPFSIYGILNSTMEDKDVLIDGGRIGNYISQPTTQLEDVINAAAIQGGSGTSDHRELGHKEANDQHPISAITGLEEKLSDMESITQVQSSDNGLSEFRKWYDGNPTMTDRAGYFVKLVTGTEDIAICDDEDDVYGVTVSHSGFVGNQSELKQGLDKSKSPLYAMVGIAGALRVRTDGTAKSGDYVVPDPTGIATRSKNGCGYKVIKQDSYAEYQYVTIAVTPQNDKISKIYGMISGTEGNGTIGNIIIQIQDVKDKVNENSQKVNVVMSDNESIKDIIEENKDNIVQAIDTSTIAYQAAQEAKENVSTVISSANEAVRMAQNAAQDAQMAADNLADTMDMINQMKPLIEFESGDYQGAAGIVEVATENKMNLGALMNTVDNQGSDLAALMLKSDGNGMAIQSLVSHIDKYTVGEYSTTYGLSQSNAMSILTGEHIYVPTPEEHVESMLKDDGTKTAIVFKRGRFYTWDGVNGTWKGTSSDTVSLATEYQAGANEGDLWLCWQDIEHHNESGDLVATYIAGTLYRWFSTVWIAVASVSDNAQSRMLTTSTQTAEDIRSEIVDARGNFSSLKQTIDGIHSIIGDPEGRTSGIFQEIDSIMLDISDNVKGSISSLQSRVGNAETSITAINAGRFHVLYQSYVGSAPDVFEGGNKYDLAPTWDDTQGIFVFNEECVNPNGVYYFNDYDKTKYCQRVDGGYEIYTIGNQVTSMLDSRVTNNESNISVLTEFKDGTTEALSAITSKTNENGASISSIASCYYHTIIKRVGTMITPEIGANYYTSPPTWDGGTNKYIFDEEHVSSPGYNTYYFIDTEHQQYCHIVQTDTGGTVSEVYGLGNRSNASIVQDVSDNRATIGMVVDNNGVRGEMIIEAINDNTSALIVADKITLDGTTTITSEDNGATRINGAHIATNTISLEQLNFTPATDKEIRAAITGFEDGLEFTVTNEEKSSIIKLTSNGTEIATGTITLQGEVVFKTDLETDGSTTINGSNIKTGVIKSKDYADNGGIFSVRGTKFDLEYGTIVSPNFSIDHNGNVNVAGDIYASRLVYDGIDVLEYVDNKLVIGNGVSLDANNLTVDGNNVMTNSKITADYLELKGLIIKNSEDEITFSIDPNGNVVLNGTIMWDDEVREMAQSAKDAVEGWTYEGSTYIDGTKIKADTVTASTLVGGDIRMYVQYNDNSPNDRYYAGGINVGGADTSEFAIELYSLGALRNRAVGGDLYLSTGAEQKEVFIHLQNPGTSSTIGTIRVGLEDGGVAFSPNSNTDTLGSDNDYWSEIYCTNATINTSDVRQKKDIEYNADMYDGFFFDLKPTQYKFVDNTSNRYHFGFISQDVEHALENNNLSSLDFAGFIKSPIYGEDGETIEDYTYALRYGEFIALNTHMIQKLYKRVEELEAKLEELKNE